MTSWKQLLTPDGYSKGITTNSAVKLISKRKALLVIYKESKERNDGFIIIVFFTTKVRKLLIKRILWQQSQQ